jgi:threonyl-tRNA synthetase
MPCPNIPYRHPPSENILTLSAHPFYLYGFSGRLAQLVRASARHAEGHWFESSIAHILSFRRRTVPQITVTLPDGKTLTAESGSTLYDIVGQIGKGLQKAAIAAEMNGEPSDLSRAVNSDISLKVYTFRDDAGKKIFRHSASHLMAQAVQRLFPKAKLAIGPAIDEGFYYDFDVETGFTPEDIEKIEAEMARIVKEDLKIERVAMSKNDAIDLFKKNGEVYKVELLESIEGDATFYKQGEFIDLCRGPHVMSTGKIAAFKLLKNAGAYWRGDEKNKMLARIYGIAFPDKKDLDEYVKIQEEAKERDHRRLGKELQLFETSQEIGSGLILWTPKGGRIRTLIEDFWRQEHYKNGYDVIFTPHIGRAQLWHTSGHLSYYKEGMYSPMDIDGEDYYVKPMNCPFHIEIFKSQKRSYREFPFRWCELGTVYRYERSGTMHGLLRVRGFTQDDAHIFCTIEQFEEEVARAFNFSLYMLKSFGFESFAIKLSTRPVDSVGSDEIWSRSEAALKKVLDASGIPYKVNEGDGAFYGPKIDIAVKDAIGRDWQLSTVQLDFNNPMRFDLKYTGSDGNEHQPIMIHRALLGSLERFFGILIEHYKGAFPAWLSPVQAKIVSVSEEESDAVRGLVDRFRSEDIRTETDLRSDTMNYKIREAVTEKVPYVLVVGKKEVADGTVSVRLRGEQKSITMSVGDFITRVKEDVAAKR